jgi:hypothetical protein
VGEEEVGVVGVVLGSEVVGEFGELDEGVWGWNEAVEGGSPVKIEVRVFADAGWGG